MFKIPFAKPGPSVELPPPEATVEAVVIKADEAKPPPTITMYFDTTPVHVAVEDIGKMQAMGWVLHAPIDLPLLAQEIEVYAQAFCQNVRAFINKSLADGRIDPSEKAELDTLTRSFVEMELRYRRLLNVAFQNYPVAEKGG